MGNRKAARPAKEVPFFSRFLEGQANLEPRESARLTGQRQLGYKRNENPPLQTLKFPSDQDELNFSLCYGNKEEVPAEYRGGGKPVTLKFPSDSDEEFWQAEYVQQTDIPRSQKVKPKAAKVQLKKSKKK